MTRQKKSLGRIAFVLAGPVERDEAARLCADAADGTYVEFIDSTDQRSIEQNKKMWPMLSEIAKQRDWPPGSGIHWSSDDWKTTFMEALGYEMRGMPNIRMTGFVNLGRSTSRLKKREFSDLIEIIYAFGAEYGVKFREPKPIIDTEGED